MPKRAQRITWRDIQTITTTAHECCDLWADPSAWQTHLMGCAARLAGCRIGIYLDMTDDAGHAANRTTGGHDVGWQDEAERRTVLAGIANHPVRFSPLWANFADALDARGRAAGGLIARQDRLIGRADWLASPMYDRHVRPTRLGEVTLSARWVPYLDAWSVFSLVTDRGAPAPGRRNGLLVRMLHAKIAPLVGTTLTTWRDRTLETVSATRRRVLELLLDGHNETKIADDLYRSRPAVHEHVTALYRHFNVGSRAELAAIFLRRRPVPRHDDARLPDLDAWLARPFAA